MQTAIGTLAEKLRVPGLAGWRQLAFDDLADLDANVLAETMDAGPDLMLPALWRC